MKNKLIILMVIYLFTLDLTGSAGESTDVNIDKGLKSIWGSMIGRLTAGDIEGALAYFTHGSRWKFRKEFSSVKDKLPEIAAHMKEIEPVYINDVEAKYRVIIVSAGNESTHYIWFRKDLFGVWKIDKF